MAELHLSFTYNVQQIVSGNNYVVDVGIEIQSHCANAVRYIGLSKYADALASCKQALDKCDKQQHTRYWAWANHLAGRAYIEISGDRFLNLKLAITYLQSALEVYTFMEYQEQHLEINVHMDKAKMLLDEIIKEDTMESVWGKIKNERADDLCFVMMPFNGDNIEGVYDQIIKPIVEANGLKPHRADSFWTPTPIMPDIWRCITTARVLIADLTNFNANVYYELGMCHALNKTPILMVQKGQDLPFDLKHFRTLFYSTDLKGSSQAKKDLDAFIKQAL